MENTEKRTLTDSELLDWARDLASDEDWEGIDTGMVYKMMLDTAGNEYDAGEADWEFSKSDAGRLLSLVT